MDKIIHIWSFDPGLMTGWCHLSVHEGDTSHFSCGETDHNGIGNLLFDNPALKSAISKSDMIETVFVVEKFIMNSKITQSPWSLETTGLIRYASSIYHIPLVEQTPSQVKKLIKDPVIKKAGLWEPSEDGHQVDAVRHALYWLTVKRGELTECLRKS